jgi:tetratricopeptide (TPR) repeat protein
MPQRHLAAARTFQVLRQPGPRAAEYTAFLTGALRTSAKASFQLGELDRAADLFGQAMLLSPEDPEARLDYAQLLFQQNKLPEARTLCEKVLASAPDHARAHLLIGQTLFAQKDYKAAQEHLEVAVVAAPAFDTGYLLGITYIKLGDFARARLVFDDLITGFGDTVRMHMMFGLAYKEGGWESLDNAVSLN